MASSVGVSWLEAVAFTVIKVEFVTLTAIKVEVVTINYDHRWKWWKYCHNSAIMGVLQQGGLQQAGVSASLNNKGNSLSKHTSFTMRLDQITQHT